MIGLAGAAMAGVPKGVVPDMSKAPNPFGKVWFGGPQTVLDQIRETEQTTRQRTGSNSSTPASSTR